MTHRKRPPRPLTGDGVRRGALRPELHRVDGVASDDEAREAGAVALHALVHSLDPPLVVGGRPGELVHVVVVVVITGVALVGVLAPDQVAHFEFAGVGAGPSLGEGRCN